MELARFPSHGGFSVRSIFTFVLAVIVTVLLATIFVSHTANAADATWNGASIEYDGKSYYQAGTAEEDQFPGIAADSRYYVSVEQPSSGSASATQKAHVIYLKPGTDPPGDGTATYALFDYNASTEALSNPTNTKSITLDVNSINAQVTTCAIEGVGWLVCPVMNFLAWGMDVIFGLIAEFMEVQPLQVNNTDGALYNAWNIMRGVANIAFVIAFLFIIYAQLTSIQVNNYGLKRLLPRLIIAAIAINISYIIAAAAVDLSNILGWSLHDVFTDLRNTVWSTGTAEAGNAAAMLSWESITGFVLSGGTAALAAGIGVAGAISATGGVAAAAVFLLLPALVGLVITILVVLLILAARQALIVILVLIAPLAIVAYLLPNTEKWFGKWRDLFMTMLIFFPAFSIVFGGSQLAGGIIIQNASSINMLILGMIVQVAPLVITPLLLRFSGSVLGGIMKLVNDPNKGILDRTRNWSKARADWQAARGRGGLDRKGNPMELKKRNFLRQSARYMDQRNRRLSDRTKNAETATQTAYENSGVYAKRDRNGKLKYDMSLQKATLEAQKEATHSHHAAHVDAARRNPSSMLYSAAIDAQAQKERAEESQNATSAFYNNIRRDRGNAARLGASALHTSSYNLEVSKSQLENTESLKQAYYQQQSATVGTTMNAAAQRAASSKEHLEVAQNQLQTFFDTQRRTAGTSLNASTIKLEESKSIADTAKSNLTTYVTNQRQDKAGVLREVTLNAEAAKVKQQISETQLSSLITEFNSGQIEASQLASPAEQVLMDQMHANSIRLAAEKRRGDSAQYEVQRTFADVMTGADTSSPIQVALTEEMRTIAQGVGGDTARVRAISNAVATARGLDSDALKANVDLLKDEARRKNTNIKYYSKDILETVLEGNSVMPDGTVLTDERIKAALQAQAEEKNIPMFEKVIGSEEFLSRMDMVKEIVSLNSPAFKGAGAFAMQDKLRTLADYIDDPTSTASIERGKEAFRSQLGLDHISNLANANATGISGWKMGEVVEVAKNLEEDIKTSLAQINRGEAPGASQADIDAGSEARRNLKAAYKTVRDALSNPDIVATMNDREDFVRMIEKELARIHGQQPTETPDFDLRFNEDTYVADIPVQEAAQNLPDNTQDTDENGNTPTDPTS